MGKKGNTIGGLIVALVAAIMIAVMIFVLPIFFGTSARTLGNLRTQALNTANVTNDEIAVYGNGTALQATASSQLSTLQVVGFAVVVLLLVAVAIGAIFRDVIGSFLVGGHGGGGGF